ncbi:MAG: hypothetical protein FWG70_07380 [Oscillospiraceae bacterium]|nr:hypothetical protein [Oscillospiraceae bacterium]
MKIIKFNTYNVINSEPFEIPFPIVFELLSGNTLLAEYTISDNGVVDYSFNPNTSEKILTSIRRPLSLNDIYFLFSSRIFPDKTPYTAIEMERFGIVEYHPYAIIRKTRGMLPGDKYWFRFENENINYKTALQEHRYYYELSYKKYLDAIEAVTPAEEQTAEEDITLSAVELTDSPEKPVVSEAEVEALSDGMINSLLDTLGENFDASTLAAKALQPEEEQAPSNEKMSDDAIAAMLAANMAAEPPSASEPAPSNEKMSDDAIAAMLAANMAAEPPSVSEPAPSNEKMSDDAIAAMLAANMAAEPPSASEPAPSNEKMSDDAIAAMLAANMAAETPSASEPAPSNEKMSDDAIAALFAQN